MPKTGNELKVGLAVFASIIILIGGIMWGKGFRLTSTRYLITVSFHNIGGLEDGGNVMANGVIKGRIKEIEFQQGRVLVTAAVDKDVKILSDYMITVEAPTVMAGNALSIHTGTQPPEVPRGEILIGQDPMGIAAVVTRMQDFTGRIEQTLGHLDTLIINLNRVVGDSGNQGNLSELLAEASETARTANELLLENREGIQRSLDELEAMLVAARNLSETADTRLPGTLDRMDSAMTAVTTLATEVRDLTAKMQSDSGTIGKLIASDEIYIRLNSTLAQVDSLAKDIRTKGLRNRIVLF